MIRKILLWLVAPLLLLALALWLLLTFGLQPEPFPAGSDSLARLAPGPLAVTRAAIDLVDPGRPTPRNRDFPASDTRPLKGAAWYPDVGGPYPLVVHVHGFTSNHRNGAYLARHLASHGYVVVAVDHPLTHMLAPGDPNARDVINQPGDVSFLIDTLSTRPGEIDPALQGRVDVDRIAVMGISLGGLTATLAGYHPQLGDGRIDAVVSIAGPTAFLAPAFFQSRSLPFLMLAGDADALVPWKANARSVLERIPGAQLLTLADGSHTGFAGGTALLRWMRNTDAAGCWSVKRNLDLEDDASWSSLLNVAEAGVDDGVELDICSDDTLPPTMHVLRQQRITQVAVRAFLDSVLHADPAVRSAATRYLRESLPRELPDVSFLAGSPHPE
ncbi:alpha/beta hydrolase family protein [Chromatocurvus halotolerans]|uniref:Chlorophyllase-like protein n=1 Tax=Chromatocurvus halotolerans TaxID=1132028 RepID=A0A4R2KW15_9GAMM|nr:hypothetical protein [Chromatocurvus halotolerans]TCO75416.1 chlorophyllase-like protein [Chromatocurvus halotolerans]